MSPAIGPSSQPREGGASLQMPPRPASVTSEGTNGPSMNSSPGGPPGGPGSYQPNMGPPPHMGYKQGPPQGGPPYPGYPGYQQPGQRPSYGGPGGAYGPGPYGPRPGGPGGPGGPPSGYPGSYQGGPGGYPHPSWNGPSMVPKAGPPQGGPPGGPPRPQGYGPPRPQGYGPPGASGMKPGYPPNSYNGPSYNGPNMPPPGSSSPGMGPPPSSSPGYPGYPPSTGGPPTSSGYPGSPGSNNLPPSSTPDQSSGPPNSESNSSSTAPAPLVTTGPDGQPMHDETSQQSTLSQSSDNSGGRQTPKGGYQQGYPHGPGTPHSSAPSPGGSLGSSQDLDGPPGGHGGPPGSPNHGWGHGGRVPASPLPGQGPPGTPGPQAKVENLQRLYEIDDHPERRAWLDKLLAFMEDRGTPISQCPTISKNPLDLYRLYMYTKDRGGFLECTNKKAWKDIAAQLGIGPSSSGAYTLKKHYGKNLLPFECHFERGGIDPAPILAQVEAQSKKKGKNAQNSSARAPSPGSQDSHDSFTGNSQDGYPGYGGPPSYNNYPPGDPRQGPPHHPESQSVRAGNPFEENSPGQGNTFNNHMDNNYSAGNVDNFRQQPPPYHGGRPYGMGGQGSQGYPPNYPPGQRPPGQEGSYGGGPPGGPGGYPGNNYPPPPGGGPPGSGWRGQYENNSGPTPPGNDMYNRGGWSGGPPGAPGQFPPRPGYPSSGSPSTTAPNSIGPPSGGPPGSFPPSSQPYTGPSDYSQKSGHPGNGGHPPGGPGGPLNPGSPVGPRMMMRPQMQGGGLGGAGPGSHPVILRANSPATPGTIQDTLPPALPVQRIPNPHGYTGGSGPMPPPGSGGSLFPGGPPKPSVGGPPNASVTPGGPPGGPPRGPASFPGPFGGPSGPRPMYPERGSGTCTEPPSTGGGPSPAGAPGSWGSGGRPGYPPSGFSGPPSSGPRPGGPPGWSGERPSPFGSQFPPNSSWGPRGPPGQPRPQFRPEMRGPQTRPMAPGRREMYNFPVDSLECTQPLMLKRKKLNKCDVQPVEGWRLVMALRSGLLMESTWALDTINILLYDDNSVAYFGLGNMPGLLEALVEHWRAALIAVFDVARDLELSNPKAEIQRKRKREKAEKSTQGLKWYEKRPAVVEDEAGLGVPDSEVLMRGEKVRILQHQPRDFTTETRFSEKDFEYEDREDELFVLEVDQEWDWVGEGFHSGEELWAAGGGSETDHILPADLHVTPQLPFVRVLRDLRGTGLGSIVPDSLRKKKDGEGGAGRDGKDSVAVSPGKKHGKTALREVWKVETKPRHPKPTDQEKDITENTKIVSVVTDQKNNSDKQSVVDKINTTPVIKPELPNTVSPECAVKCEPGSEETTTSSKVEVDKNKNIDPLQDIRDRTGIVVKEGAGFETRWVNTVLEEENFQPDCASLNLVTENQDNLGKRAIVVSTIFRNLSFVPGNETVLSSCPGFLAICGKMLVHYHWHPARTSKQRNYDRGEEEDFSESCTSLGEQEEWWWDHLQVIRENVMVSLANIAGHMDLTDQPECLVRPLLSGLLEWAVSPSAAAQDPFATVGPSSPISPQRLAIESLCKLCVQEANVDLLLSTPPFSRIEKLCGFLSRKLYRSEDQVLREFAINLLFYFSQADSGVARTIALQETTVSLLIGFIEQAESNALIVAQNHGVNALRDNPDSMGTSLDMLRRAANTLNHLAKHEDNRALFVRQEQRLLNLVMSQILDQGVASIISQVLFQVSSPEAEEQSD